MKHKCASCKNDLSSNIISNFSNYAIGYIYCPKCKRKDDRYISELDCWIYGLFSSLIYFIGMMVIVFALNVGNIFASIAIIALAAIILYKVLTLGIFYIYDKAPLKEKWKHYNFNENSNNTRILVFQKFIIIFMTFYAASDINNISVVALLFVFMIIFIGLRIFQKYQFEKKYYMSHRRIK